MSYPASVVSSDPNIQHLQTVVYFQRKAIDDLRAFLATYPCMEKQPVPMNNGKVMQFFVNNQFGNTSLTPASEGTPGAPIAHPGSVKNTVTLQQYSDHISFSDTIVNTSISNIIDDTAVQLSYKAARGVDQLNYTLFDTSAAADSVSRIDLDSSADAAVEYMSGQTVRRARFSLLARNVLPKSGSNFMGILHPLQAFDMVNDNTAGGVLDILKRQAGYGDIKSGLFDKGESFPFEGVVWKASTEVETTSNYDSGGQTGYHAYVIGRDAFFATSLGSFKGVPDSNNFRVDITRFPVGSQVTDPAGLIRAAAYYKFYYATYIPPDSVSRFRRIRSEVSIS